jgi:hypothetical protein
MAAGFSAESPELREGFSTLEVSSLVQCSVGDSPSPGDEGGGRLLALHIDINVVRRAIRAGWRTVPSEDALIINYGHPAEPARKK